MTVLISAFPTKFGLNLLIFSEFSPSTRSKGTSSCVSGNFGSNIIKSHNPII